MEQIKFKRAHFIDDAKTQFSHHTEWGVGIGQASFISPSSNNFALYFTDKQYTGLKDKFQKDIYEGDTVEAEMRESITGQRTVVRCRVEFRQGCFGVLTLEDKPTIKKGEFMPFFGCNTEKEIKIVKS